MIRGLTGKLVSPLLARRSLRIAAPGRDKTEAAKGLWRERGAAAVEFALVMPLLLILVLGIAEFGRAWNTQTTLSAAAREGVRVMALQNDASAARTATKSAAAPAVILTDGQITGLASCPAPGTNPLATTKVTITYPMTFITTFFGTSITLTGTGVMRCNG